MKQIFEIDCENEQITAKFLSDYLKNHFDTLAYNDSYLERRAVYVGHHHTRRHFKVDIKVKEITSALQHLNMLRNKTHPPKKRVTIDTEGEEFKQAVRKVADEVRVKAEKTKCRFGNMVSMYCKGVEAEAKERVKERERSEAAEKDYAEMLSKSQSGAPFDGYGLC